MHCVLMSEHRATPHIIGLISHYFINAHSLHSPQLTSVILLDLSLSLFFLSKIDICASSIYYWQHAAAAVLLSLIRGGYDAIVDDLR